MPIRPHVPSPVTAPTTRERAGSGQRIGPYEVLLDLGQGGMGAVHLARAVGGPVGASRFERLVAIKRVHQHLLTDPQAVRRFLEEARLAARVHHANVVGVHQVGSDADGYFLVQDYVEGDTLEGLVDRSTLRRERLPPPVVLRIALDALAGLHAVHEATDPAGNALGILHRDVAIQNLLVGRDGVTRLSDFGIAKHQGSAIVTDAGYRRGRVLYMAPEYLQRKAVDRRLDVYGLGVTLWIALSGKSPWGEASEAELVHRATTEGVPPLSSSGLDIAPAIEAVVARACQRLPEERFGTARAMLDAIEEIGRNTGWLASHADTGEIVERLAGKELAARRAVLAAREHDRAGEVAGAREGAPGPAGVEHPSAGASVPAAPESASWLPPDADAPRAARVRAWGLAVVISVAVFAAVAFALGRTSSVHLGARAPEKAAASVEGAAREVPSALDAAPTAAPVAPASAAPAARPSVPGSRSGVAHGHRWPPKAAADAAATWPFPAGEPALSPARSAAVAHEEAPASAPAAPSPAAPGAVEPPPPSPAQHDP